MSKRDYAKELQAAATLLAFAPQQSRLVYIDGAAETMPSGFYVIRTLRGTWLVASEYDGNLDGADELILMEGSVNDLDETSSCYLLAHNEKDRVLLFDAIGENYLGPNIIWRG